MTQDELQADWIVTKNIVHFQELLSGETDEGRYSILSQLLAEKFDKFKKPQTKKPISASGPDSVVVDVGKPLVGFLLGVLLIAGTMGSFFLWDNYQGGVDAKAAVVTAQNR